MLYRSGTVSLKRRFGCCKFIHLGSAVIACLALGYLSTVAPALAAEPKVKIAFAGDSLVDNYWAGVSRLAGADACLKTRLELGRFAHNGTGLSRGDRLYWPREIKRIGDAFKPNLFVISIGLNDRQFIVDATGARTAWGSPNWTQKYRDELDEFLKAAAAGGAGVMLIGLPAMRDTTENRDAADKNKIFADAVAAMNTIKVQYVPPWRVNGTGAADAFASFGPDKNGRLVQIRTPDGEHFTTAGEDIIAAYVYPKIAATLTDMGIRIDCPSAMTKEDR